MKVVTVAVEYILIGIFFLCCGLWPSTLYAAPLSLEDCVKQAIQHSSNTLEVAARVQQFEARLSEVESIFYPKLTATAFVAPMFTVEGDAFAFKRHWQRLSDWGPYTHLQALLLQPIYTFGRVEAGKRASRSRIEVERARLRAAENTVALEVKKLHFSHLLANSMIPMLTSALESVGTALQKASQLYEEGTGGVLLSDIMKLRYAQTEVMRYLAIAEDSAKLALAALKHTMGLMQDADLELDLATLPKLPTADPLTFAAALSLASEHRPEWTQLDEGKKAALALEEAERLANWPVVFLAGQLTVDWTPTRDSSPNPYQYDPYNRWVGGVALGLQFNLDPAMASAKAKGAEAMGAEVDALWQFAKTGIPLQVKKAYDDMTRSRRLVDITHEGVMATRKWLTFAANAYSIGTGEAKDLLEGLMANLQARRAYYEGVYTYFLSVAELDYAVGRP